MFRVKICGITNVEDARMVVEAGADSIGLNFHASSPRFCPSKQAKAIVKAVGQKVCKVGVFVNATPKELRSARKSLGLDLLQLHGDETPEFLREIRGLPVMRAFRVGDDLAPIQDYLQACHRLNCTPRMILLDAMRPGHYGGTGETLDWQVIRRHRVELHGLPVVLAGGLKPANVASAIEAVHPWGVDTASGVESKPGSKSAELVREFVAAARGAFTQIAARR